MHSKRIANKQYSPFNFFGFASNVSKTATIGAVDFAAPVDLESFATGAFDGLLTDSGGFEEDAVNREDTEDSRDDGGLGFSGAKQKELK